MAQVNTIKTSADALVTNNSGDNNVNAGSQPHLATGEYSDGTLSRIYCNFDIFSVAPRFSRISSALLELCQYDSSDDWQSPVTTVAATLAAAAWTEGGITYSNAPGAAAGSPLVTRSVHGDNTWLGWNVTAAMQKVYDGSMPWYGFYLYYTGSSSSTAKYYRSKEYSNGAYAPRLTLTSDYPYPQLQVAGGWHQINDVWINVGDVWKQVTELLINIGGEWKTPS